MQKYVHKLSYVCPIENMHINDLMAVLYKNMYINDLMAVLCNNMHINDRMAVLYKESYRYHIQTYEHK